MTYTLISASYKDPSGFLFKKGDLILRQINNSYSEEYTHFIQSGLYQKLVDLELLVSHKEVNIESFEKEISYKIIQPDLIEFISYPYEWCFSQLKDAALLTLNILKISLEHGMILKDASAYNVQFKNGKPIFIDTLSFDLYKEGMQWQAYKQFCEHFLGPLALIAHTDYRLNELSKSFLDGIPLDLVSKLLPKSSIFSSLLLHIHSHAKSMKMFTNDTPKPQKTFFSKRSLLGLIDSLEGAVKSLEWKPFKTLWSNYYSETNYSNDSFNEKKTIVQQFFLQINPKFVWDIGANTGEFSRIVSSMGANVLSLDFDPFCVEKNYLLVKENKEKNIFPLINNLTNPTPALGFENKERDSLLERKNPDSILALALIHHLCIGSNVPLARVASFLSKCCTNLVVEFVPKSDSQVKRMLAFREDIFHDYSESGFESAFKMFFTIKEKHVINNSERSIYLMTRHG